MHCLCAYLISVVKVVLDSGGRGGGLWLCINCLISHCVSINIDIIIIIIIRHAPSVRSSACCQ